MKFALRQPLSKSKVPTEEIAAKWAALSAGVVCGGGCNGSAGGTPPWGQLTSLETLDSVLWALPHPQTAPALRPTYQPVQLKTGGGGGAGGALRGRSAASAGPTASAAKVTPESNSFFIIQSPFALRRCTPPKISRTIFGPQFVLNSEYLFIFGEQQNAAVCDIFATVYLSNLNH